METQYINLHQLPLNQSGIIEEINCNEGIKRRLLDLGLVKGTSIIPVLVSPSRDPRAFSVRGTTIAIRKEDAENIKIFPEMSQKGRFLMGQNVPLRTVPFVTLTNNVFCSTI